MTAEEILEKNCIAFDAGEYAIDCDKAHTCMEEYAKQQVLGFQEWIKKGDWFQDRDGSWNYSAFESAVRIAESTEKLYALYLKVNKPL